MAFLFLLLGQILSVISEHILLFTDQNRNLYYQLFRYRKNGLVFDEM